MLQKNKTIQYKLKHMVGEICGGVGVGVAEGGSIRRNPCRVTCLQIVKCFPSGLQLIVTETPFQPLISYFLQFEMRLAATNALKGS
jgi:hypothetical protein